MSDRERYPLSWPEGWKRTVGRTDARFKKQKPNTFVDGQARSGGFKRLSVEESFDRIEKELRAFDVDLSTVIVSTNLKLNMRGLPAGNSGEPSDPGVAVYWTAKGKKQCMAIDSYCRVADNLAAVAATLDAMRAIERHGGAQILERAFLGFAQLPERVGKPWRDVLQFHPNAFVTANTVQDRFRALASKRHPDSGGSHDSMSELNAARPGAGRTRGQVNVAMNCSYCGKLIEPMRRGGSSKTDTCSDCFWNKFPPRKTLRLRLPRRSWRSAYHSVPNPEAPASRP